jgi:hypothetical protein
MDCEKLCKLQSRMKDRINLCMILIHIIGAGFYIICLIVMFFFLVLKKISSFTADLINVVNRQIK